MPSARISRLCNSGEKTTPVTRRAFCTALATLATWQESPLHASRISASVNPQIEEFDFSTLNGLVTPSGEFFVRNHFVAPNLKLRSWRLRITGSVKTPLDMTFSDLLRESTRTLSVTLECAGNRVGGGAVGTARWTGVPLERLLRLAGLGSAVKNVRLVGADRGIEDPSRPPTLYMRSLPLEKALHPDTLLVYQMNGGHLPVEHGFPLRALVPGWYAMDSVKWLDHIEVLEHEDRSLFMTERYLSNQWRGLDSEKHRISRVQVKSQIARPREGELIGESPYVVRGAAWAGENRVTKVQVSVDEGKEWHLAEIDKEQQPYTWVLWKFYWSFQRPGSHVVSVRAFDHKGNEQPLSRDLHRLDGYELNWVHSVRCIVK